VVDFDHGLNVAIRRLRQALGDAAENPGYIETVPRKGYRFLAPAEIFAAPAPSPSDSPVSVAQPHRSLAGTFRSRKFWVITIASAVAAVIPLVAAFFGYSLSGQSSSGSQNWASPNWKIRPVTRFPGLELKAAWSPDGRFVTFSWFHPDENIFVMPLSGGDPVQLTHSTADDSDPRWSPDSRYIAYLGDTGRTKLVYLIAPSGGEPRLLADMQIPFMERFVESW